MLSSSKTDETCFLVNSVFSATSAIMMDLVMGFSTAVFLRTGIDFFTGAFLVGFFACAFLVCFLASHTFLLFA